MTAEVGRFERANVREAWPNEERDFTPWLATPENLGLLGQAVRMDLELVGTEVSVGPYYADILCRETSEQDSLIVIENQFGRTDPDHLGRLFVYAAGLKANTLIWIAETFQDDHRAALDWINSQTIDGIDVFGIEMELWRIGNSLPAPRFNIVSQPNNWSEAVRDTARRVVQGEMGEREQMFLEYWTQFRDRLASTGLTVRPTKPHPQRWMDMTFCRGVGIYAAIAPRTGLNRVSLKFTGADREICHRLELDQVSIERELGFNLTFEKATKADYLRRDEREQPIMSHEDWPRQHQWMCDTMRDFQRVLLPRIEHLRIELRESLPIDGSAESSPIQIDSQDRREGDHAYP